MLSILNNSYGSGYCIPSEKLSEYRKKFPHNYFILEVYYTKEEKNNFTNFYWKENSPNLRHIVNTKYKFDSFSPNFNKLLHVGHLRNLITTLFLVRTFNGSEFHSCIGTALGIIPEAVLNFDKYDVLFKLNLKKYYEVHLDPTTKQFTEGTDEYEGCLLYNNVVVRKSDGKHTYAYYELCFDEQVGVDYIFTGEEQKDHFKSLGLGHKHKPLGLIIGNEGKLKSRDGKSLLITDLLTQLEDRFPDLESNKIAWNILIGKITHVKRESTVKFDLEKWLDIKDNLGLYSSYTLCRFKKALGDQKTDLHLTNFNTWLIKAIADRGLSLSIEEFCPSHINKALKEVCNIANTFYQTTTISNSSDEVIAYTTLLIDTIKDLSNKLGLFQLEKI